MSTPLSSVRLKSQPVLTAELRPQLILKRISPNAQQLDGPVLYQLLFNASGTPGKLARFDTNPRHLTNSLISDNGTQVAIGGLSIDSGGVISFAGGQTFPGSVSSVTAGNSFITIGGTATNPTVALNTGASDARYLQLGGGTMTGTITFAGGQTFPGTGTVTNIATGTGLSGGPITTTGTLSIDTAVVPRLDVANTFSALNTFNGGVSGSTAAFTGNVSSSAGVFNGDGSGLTNLSADALASGTVPATRLSGTYNIDISGNAATATTATTANNALALGGNAAASYNTTAQNDLRYLQLGGGTLVGPLNGTNASFSSNIHTDGALSLSIPNEGTTGTLVNQLVELTGDPLTAINAGLDAGVGTIGVVIDGAGTSGLAEVAIFGAADCLFDGATVAGNYVVKSTTDAGKCHDSGSAYPVGAQVIGRAIFTNVAATTSKIALFPPEERSSTGAVTSVTAGDSSITIGGTASAPTVAVAANGITNANIAEGSINPAKISGTAATLGANTFVGDQNVTGSVAATSFSGNGSALTNLNADSLSSGTVPQARLSGSYNIDISGNAATATTASNALALGGNAAASYNTTTQNDLRYLQLGGGTLTGALNGTTASFSGDIQSAGNLQTAGALSVPIQNEATTGTTVNQLVELTGDPLTAINAGTNPAVGTIGLVISGAGTTGTAQIAIFGAANCVFDNATVAGDYVVKSTTTPGNCHDSGATYPTGVQVIGRTIVGGGAGTALVALFPPEERSNAGTVTSVGASAPLSSSGGATPTISLTGVISGGNLPLTTSSADTTAGHLVQANDTRLSDSRAAASMNFGTATLSGTVPGANLPLTTSSADTTAGHLVQANDTRLSDARAASSVNFGTATLTGSVPGANLPNASTSAKGIVQLGISSDTAAGLAVQTNDARLSDSRAAASVNFGTATLTGAVPGANLPLTTSSADTTAGHLVQANDTRLSDARAASSVNFGTATLTGSVPGANLPNASTSAKGIVQLGISSDTAAGLAVQTNDTRLSDSRAAASVNFGTATLTGTVPGANLPLTTSSADTTAGHLVQANDTRLSDARAASSVNFGTATLSGAVPTANGGTGLGSSGSAGNYLRSNGSAWQSSSIQVGDVPDLSGTVYNASGTKLTTGHTVTQLATLGGGGTLTTTFAGAAAFTNASSYDCAARDITSTFLSLSIAYTSGSSITISGGVGGDSIHYTCTGN